MFLKGTATSATVTDNVNGFIEEDDVNKYARRILEIMKNKKLYQEVCDNAYKDLYKNWDDTIKDVYERYLKLINDKRVDK